MKLSGHGIQNLAEALAKAQGEFASAERAHIAKVQSKKGEGSSYSYAYADLAAYLEVCREPLKNNGLAFVQDVSVDGQKATVTTLLTHASGQWLESSPLTLTAADAMPQSVGSAVTYARRYSLSAVLGMASEADDDANGAQGNRAATAPKESNLPACPQCQTNKSVIAGKPEYGGGFVCFAKKGGCGAKWQADGEIPPENGKPKQEEPKPEPLDAERKAADDLQIVQLLTAVKTHAGYPDALNNLKKETRAAYKGGNGYLQQRIVNEVVPAIDAELAKLEQQPA